MSEASPELAVVVLSVGAPVELKTAVDSLLAQPIPIEIVVVNSGGGDPRSVLSSETSGISVISTPQLLWPGAARNVGIRSTRAPWVAFLASDLVASPGWAANRLLLHKKGRNSVASALVNSHPRNLYAWASHLSVLVRRMPGVPKKKALRYGASYARTLFEKYGGFREDLRVGEDTEFHRRMKRADRPVWAPSVQASHLNPTNFRQMIQDQLARGKRAAIHWPALDESSLLRRGFSRFMLIAPLSFRSVRGLDRLFVVASWPLVLACTFAYERGVDRGQRELARAGGSGAARVTVVAILDRDDWQANTDIVVVVDPTYRHLTWIPRDLWVPSLNDRINAAFAIGGGDLLLKAVRELGFRAESLLCVRRAATEAALEAVSVTVPVSEPLDFWYPLHPTRPIEEGRKAISFRPPEELLSGERLHQWIGARSMINRSGSDLLRLDRQQLLLKALLAADFDFQRVLRDPSLYRTSGKNPLAALSRVGPDWYFSTLGPLKDATTDGKAVLVKG
ncbi:MULTISPECIES: glycosyltransferase family A protein [unclassified Mesorhizobium]|uniref:glycosyltransferase family A protein n=1 Tax=unclassified Mesorhizobium TaxID=325217 RepID=UPI000F754BA4|nr:MULTISPECIES: glycosyltransferase family A protein [unclassified Mesorhizobium]AZO68443.1 glycosyltransferase [Mesorhizobium sp. M6A.T.Cr.TU.016.01.1.1]RWP54807.1 MAG: glycosyltransferase [Mesorhizobium sp.]